MLMKLFRKPTLVSPPLQHDSTLAEALARRVNAIDFQPSRGFLKDQWQQKRTAASLQLESPDSRRSHAFSQRLSAQTSG